MAHDPMLEQPCAAATLRLIGELVCFSAAQLGLDAGLIELYRKRQPTISEHLGDLLMSSRTKLAPGCRRSKPIPASHPLMQCSLYSTN